MELNRHVSIGDIFGLSFWIWFILSFICVILMILAPNYKNEISSVILATMMILPVRDWTYQLTIWIIAWAGSGTFPTLKTIFRQIFTMTDLASPTIRMNNTGVYRLLRFIIFIVNTITAILWMANPNSAFKVVYSWLHTIEYLFTMRIGWYSLLFYILLTIAFWGLMFWALMQIINERMLDRNGHFSFGRAWWRITIIVAGFYIKIILSGILLKFTKKMIFDSIAFWTSTIGLNIFAVLAFEGIRLVVKRATKY